MIDVTSVDQIADAMRADKPRSDTSYAVVERIGADGTIWARMVGAEGETPCGTFVAVKGGDVVKVRVSNGRAVIEGNESDRSASGDEAAITADKLGAVDTVATEASDAASAAKKNAGAAQTAADAASALSLQTADLAALIKASLKGYATTKYVDEIINQIDPDDGSETHIVIGHSSGILFMDLRETSLVYWGNEWPNKIFEAKADGTGYIMGKQIATTDMIGGNYGGLTARPSAATTIAAAKAYYKVNLNTQATAYGSGISVANGSIRCANAGTVRVSFNARLTGLSANDRMYATIFRGASGTTASDTQIMQQFQISPGNFAVIGGSRIVSVAANDYITLGIYNDTAARGANAYTENTCNVTVEYV